MKRYFKCEWGQWWELLVFLYSIKWKMLNCISIQMLHCTYISLRTIFFGSTNVWFGLYAHDMVGGEKNNNRRNSVPHFLPVDELRVKWRKFTPCFAFLQEILGNENNSFSSFGNWTHKPWRLRADAMTLRDD